MTVGGAGIGARFRVEGRLQIDDHAAEADYHFSNHMIDVDA